VPLEEAAASGVTAHLWALVFVAGFGVLGWAVVLVRGANGGEAETEDRGRSQG